MSDNRLKELATAFRKEARQKQSKRAGLESKFNKEIAESLPNESLYRLLWTYIGLCQEIAYNDGYAEGITTLLRERSA